jgi:hypothetical protein
MITLMAAAIAFHAAPATADKIWISITNDYEAKLNFGPLGKGDRKGKDRAEGTLTRQGADYVGIVDAEVVSKQQVKGLGQNCGPADYNDSQELKVIGRRVGGFNDEVQNPTASTGQPSNEFLILEFIPETHTRQEPQARDPVTNGLEVNCHTLIETPAGIPFLPLNDSRWTMEGGGYIIQLPASGTLDYTDTAVAEGNPQTIGPFQVLKSVWKVTVKRLP